jgi:hypothetical protein
MTHDALTVTGGSFYLAASLSLCISEGSGDTNGTRSRVTRTALARVTVPSEPSELG